MAYYNGFVEDANALADAMNVVVSSAGDEGLEAARSASLVRIEALAVTTAGRGDWLGDDTLLVGMRSQADVDGFNALVVELNTGLPAAMDHWGSAVAGFQSHWHMDEFAAWQAEHAVWAESHPAGNVVPSGLTGGGVGP